MKIVVGVALFSLLLLCRNVYANSYLQMLTTPPENRTDVNQSAGEENYFPDNETLSALPNNWWYDSRITTKAPVEVSQYPKYYAWLNSQNNQEPYYSGDTQEQLQELWYAVEAGFIGWGLYHIYKY